MRVQIAILANFDRYPPHGHFKDWNTFMLAGIASVAGRMYVSPEAVIDFLDQNYADRWEDFLPHHMPAPNIPVAPNFAAKEEIKEVSIPFFLPDGFTDDVDGGDMQGKRAST